MGMSEPAESNPAKDRRNGFGNLIPIKPGEVRNPNGFNQIHTMMRKVRERTKNGEEILDVIYSIMKESNSEVVRLKAAEMLRDWGFGKPKEIKDTGEAPSILNIANLSPEKFDILIALLKEAS